MTGERCFLTRPDLNSESWHRFVDTFAQAFPDRLHLRLLDHRGFQKAHRLMRPTNVRLVC